MKTTFKHFSAALVALCACAFATLSAAAEPYPAKPIRWIVPYSAGGGTDAMARALGAAMQRSIGQTVVIDNRPGASTNIGVAALLQSPADGYTVMQAENAALLFNEHLFSKLTYKPATDFTYIASIGRVPVALVVHPDFPARTLAEFVALARAKGGTVPYASPGNGSPHHLAMAMFEQTAGIKLTHVPYKGAAPALQDLMGGQVPVMMLDLATGLQAIRSGKVRGLALAAPARAASLPNLATFSELGFNGVTAMAFHGLIGPAGMAPETVARLNAEVNRALQDPKVVELFDSFAFEALPGTPQSFQALARAESARWGAVIKAANVTLD